MRHKDVQETADIAPCIVNLSNRLEVWSASRSGHFTPEERETYINWKGE
jgi:hypothetical protein